MKNEVSLNIFQKDYESALTVLDQGRMLASGESFDSEDNWSRMEKFLNRRLDQIGEGLTSQDRIASDENRRSKESQPLAFALEANYPNPFNPVTVIPFSVPEQSHVRLEVYDILGRRVAVLAPHI